MSKNIHATKRILLETTAKLLQKQGYNATALNQILELSGAPKGSLYYHFPGGKEQLAFESISYTLECTKGKIEELFAKVEDPVEAVKQLFLTLEEELIKNILHPESEPDVPIGVLAHEISNASELIRQVCCEAYEVWISILQNKFIAGGLDPTKARELSTFIVNVIEGAAMMSMTLKSTNSFLSAAEGTIQLLQLALQQAAANNASK